MRDRAVLALALVVGLLVAGPAAGAGPSDLFPPEWAARVERASRLLEPDLRLPMDGAPVWDARGETFVYWAADRSLRQVEPAARGQHTLADWSRLSGLLAAAGARDLDKATPSVAMIDGRPVLDFPQGGVTWRVDAAAGSVRRIENAPPAAELALSRDGQAAAFVRGNDLYVTAPDRTERRITTDGDVWYSFDPRLSRSHPVNRPDAAPPGPPNVIWLPGPGHRLLVERWDYRGVGSNWMIDALAAPRPKVVEQRMALPGETALPRPEFWIVDADTGAARRVDAGDWAFMGNMDVGGGGYFPSPDGRTVLFNRMSRDYGVVELVELTLADGRQRVVVREENPAGFGVRFPQAAFIDGGRAILWKSDRTGRIQFWRVDLATGAQRQVTRGEATVERVLHVDDRAGRVYYAAYGDGAGGEADYLHTWSVDLRSGRTRRLDAADTTHVAVFAPDGATFVDRSSRVDLPTRTQVRRASDGQVLVDLGVADTGPLTRLGWTPPERVKVKAADGTTDLYGVMWKPRDFDPARKYPVVTQVYPGPYGEGYPLAFTPQHPNAALAELGFIVVRVGQRGGSPVRDAAYARYSRTQGNVRDYPVADNRAALIGLGASRPYMDLDRVGIIGESGGGFMTVAAMLAYPDFYKAGVAAAGNHDNLIYEQNSSELYWGVPGRPGSARYDSNAAAADRLKGALLLVHGDQDEDVNLASSTRLIDALNRAGKAYDFLLLPGSGHFNFDPATRDYYRRRTWSFLVQHLQAAPAS